MENKKLFLKWKWAGDAGFFEYYDKEAGENKKYKFDQIKVENVSYTIIGWDDASNSNIYSNDITDFNNEPFSVKSWKGGQMFEGIYKEIKEQILNAWAKLHIKVEGVDKEGQRIVLTLKGLNFFQLSETLKTLSVSDDLLAFDKAEDDKKGAVKFKKTVFKKWGKVTSEYISKETSGEEIDMSDVPF